MAFSQQKKAKEKTSPTMHLLIPTMQVKRLHAYPLFVSCKTTSLAIIAKNFIVLFQSKEENKYSITTNNNFAIEITRSSA
jgi:hypothetical protein